MGNLNPMPPAASNGRPSRARRLAVYFGLADDPERPLDPAATWTFRQRLLLAVSVAVGLAIPGAVGVHGLLGWLLGVVCVVLVGMATIPIILWRRRDRVPSDS